MRHGWSLNIAMWRLLKELFEEYQLEWNKFPLDKGYKRMIPEKQSGVYMLCLPPMECESWFLGEDKLNIFNAIYVGSSKNLQKRFGNYVDRKNISRTIKNFLGKQKHLEVTFGYAVCDLSVIIKIEGVLIKCFGPSANDRDEDGASLPATLGEERDI